MEKESFDELLGKPEIQAFPDEFETGMTLRDYFAAKAMQAYIGVGDGPLTKEIITKNAFEMADAMLEARSK